MVRILVVDDDLAIREMLHIMLEYTGYQVTEAADGAEALEIIRSSSEPLVVLLDVMMPDVTGLDVLQTVERNPYLSTRHGYILVTASREIESLVTEKVVQKLSVPLIAKPFEMKHLLDTVECVIHRVTMVATGPVAMLSSASC